MCHKENVDEVYELLWKRGVPVVKYHAGMDTEARKKSQEDFIYDRLPVIVATNALVWASINPTSDMSSTTICPRAWRITIRRPDVPGEMENLRNAFCCSRPGML